jgi:hypothetical protein
MKEIQQFEIPKFASPQGSARRKSKPSLLSSGLSAFSAFFAV